MIRQRLVDANPAVTDYQRELAASLNLIGHTQGDIGQTDEALQSLEKGRAIAQKLVDVHPARNEFYSALGYIYNAMGLLQWRTGHMKEALQGARGRAATLAEARR